MVHVFRPLFNSAFFRHNAIFLIGSILVGVCNYAYYPVLARLLEPGHYGEVQALASLFTQLILFLVVLSQVTVNIVANYQDEAKKRAVIFELEKLALLIGVVVTILFVMSGWKLKMVFQFESTWPLLLLLAALLINIPAAFRSAYLRAHKKFGAVSVGLLAGSFGKIVLSALLVMAGFEVLGAIWGIVLAQVLALMYATYKAGQLGFMKPPGATYFSKPNIKVLVPELKYALLVLTGSLAITVLSTVDIFIVKHYFDPHTAGLYAGVSTVAKIIFFLTASVAQVLLPSIKLDQPTATNRQLLLKSIALASILGGGALLVFTFFARTIVQGFMGATYLEYTSLLPALSLAMFLISILNVIISYYLALRKFQIGIVVAIGTIVTVGFMLAFHDSLKGVAYGLVYGSLASLGLLGGWRITREFQIRRQHA